MDTRIKQIYEFVDAVPFDKSKKNLNRDFSDGCMMAEVIRHYLPKSHKYLVNTHNYIPSLQIQQKIINWKFLYQKVIKVIE